jgi:hypothetical protein
MWVETRPGLWRSVDGHYVIIQLLLPEDLPEPSKMYVINRFDPSMVAVRPGNLGYFRGQEDSLKAAQDFAARDAYCFDHHADRSVSEDFPAVALERFCWPIDYDGASMGALAIVRDGGRVLARIIGMHRQEDPFVPYVLAELDITDMVVPAAGMP